MKKTYIYLLLFALSAFSVSCQCHHRVLPDFIDPPRFSAKPGKECPPSSLTYSISDESYNFLSSDWSYQPKEIVVSSSQTILEAMLDANPGIGDCYFDLISCLGGAKLIGEMSADKAGYFKSTGPVNINVLPLCDIHLNWVNDFKNIFIQVLEGNICLYEVYIPQSFLSFTCEFEMQNETDDPQEVVIPAGQMLEVNGNDVQNVVVSKARTIYLLPHEQTKVSVPILCAAHHRGNPQGYAARVTPFILDTQPQDYDSQYSLWNRIESAEVTFYAWRSGDRIPTGRSRYGHAFVRLPGVGVIGFGPRHKSKRILLGDEGRIFDHSSQVKYATDSCRIKVSDTQLKAMIDKLEELQSNVPDYELGRYDCTSFTMDIADAGGINYGYRSAIQWPISFIEELKAHNSNQSYSYSLW